MTNYLTLAYTWLCNTRAHHSANSDCWSLRFNWEARLPLLQTALRKGDYQFSPLQQFRFPDKTISLYCSQDSLILKALSLQLNDQIAQENLIQPSCYHIKNQGGLKQAVKDTRRALDAYQFVFKSDIKGYYASLCHDTLCTELETLTQNTTLTRLVRRSIEAPSTWGGLYYDRQQGIPRGSPLSPLLGAIALNQLDVAMGRIKNIFYARYMDDWVVLCKTRHQLRSVIKQTYKILDKLKLKLHPDKTFIGKIQRGFDFLGYHFKPNNLSVAKATFERALAKLRRLYEQGAPSKRLAQYWRRFLQWVKGGMMEWFGSNVGSEVKLWGGSRYEAAAA